MLKNLLSVLYYSWQRPERMLNYLQTGYVSGIEVVINHEKKCVYVLNPKVATTSIVRFLSNYDPDELEKTTSHKKKRKLKGISYLKGAAQLEQLQREGYFVFSFVRNPYTRVISFFKQKYTLEQGKGYKHRAFALSRGLERVASFEDMVKKMASIPDEVADTHFMSQTAILYEQAKGVDYDFVGKLETFETDFANVQNACGISSVPGKDNATQNDDWQSYLSVETERLIYERFKSDFIEFGYERFFVHEHESKS